MTGTAPRWAGWRGLLLIWLGACAAILLIYAGPISRLQAADGDDYMRLAQVRDWLAGQSWFDVRQYRMGPRIVGIDMHWTRLVDVPVASALWPLSLVLPEPAASAAAMTIVPLLQLLLAMVLVRRVIISLGGSERTGLIAAALVPLFPFLLTTFAPLRIDHHGWQALAALGCAASFLSADRRAPWLAGCLAAAWLTISLEGLPLVAVLGALYAWRTLRRGAGDLAQFLAALALASAALFVLTRPLWIAAQASCDQLSWPHIGAFAGAALVSWIARLSTRDFGVKARAAGLAAAAVAAGAFLLWSLGPCAVDPWAGMDPVVKTRWLNQVPEGMPIGHQPLATAVMLVWTLLLALAGSWSGRRDARNQEDWHLYAVLTLAAGLLSLLVMRGGIIAQLLTVPFAAVLAERLVPRARAVRGAVPRILATVAAVLVITPLFVTAAAKLVDVRASAATNAPERARVGPQASTSACDLRGLSRLSRTRLFTQLGLGPEILVRTSHSVVSGNYHRDQRGIRTVLEVFGGDPARAEARVQASGAPFLLFCAADPEAQVHARQRPDSLAAQLLSGTAPEWLAPVPGYGPGLSLYRVIAR